MWWLILALVALVLLASWVTWTAGRIERLGARCEGAWQSLDAQLVRRGAALDAVADRSSEHDGVRATGQRALAAPRDARAEAENAVSAAVAGLPPGVPDDRLSEACIRVKVARTFYNDAVRASTALRAQRLPRMLGLGRATLVPPYFDIDDNPGTLAT